MTQEIKLPPLPCDQGLQDPFIQRSLQAYARAAVEHDRQGRGEPVAINDAYDKVDRFLRNNLDDDDYAEYSEALDAASFAPQPADPVVKESLTVAEPVKVPSDAEIHDVIKAAAEDAVRHDRVFTDIELARALLARYGNASIHLQDLKNAVATTTELRQQLDLMDEKMRGEAWRWQADGTDNLATMGNRMGVLIYACDLRALLAQPAAYKDSTPDVRVGDSSFEAWFSSYDPAGNGDKQRAREAYAAGRDAGLSVAVEIICEAQEEARQEHMYPGLVATLDECARDVSALKSDAKEPA